MIINRAAPVLLVGLAVFANSGACQTTSCLPETTKNGETYTIRGEAVTTGHDLLIRPSNCPEVRVILVYGDDPSLGDGRVIMRRDESFGRFEKYLSEELPAKPKQICDLCLRYRVTADFQGQLEVAPSAGMKRDPKTGKGIGFEGFGSPRPFTRYRLRLMAVSNVRARER